MFFRQIVDDRLGCCSYIIASSSEAAIVDPGYDIAPYERILSERSLRLRYVIDCCHESSELSVSRFQFNAFPEMGAIYNHVPLCGGVSTRWLRTSSA